MVEVSCSLKKILHQMNQLESIDQELFPNLRKLCNQVTPR